MSRAVLWGAVLAGAWLLPVNAVLAQSSFSSSSTDDSGTYVSPTGAPPPVAPPIRKGSPLDHLVNDPKVDQLTVGYKEGNTTGSDYWIGHRRVDDADGQGWGWVKKPGDNWVWIALQETPGVAVAPFRHLTSHAADDNWEFKFWGKMATYKAYDPHLDEILPVFVLDGYEVIGPEPQPTAKIGPPGRIGHRASGASSREDRPIGNSDVD